MKEVFLVKDASYNGYYCDCCRYAYSCVAGVFSSKELADDFIEQRGQTCKECAKSAEHRRSCTSKTRRKCRSWVVKHEFNPKPAKS